ncbi:hypothetical protein BKA67DRAFT_682656 [Truncatella angustata]|uniref:Uncharacterized protein n=1 Tax=Truncatella angustata TaxID=152316 RepID=A0A9P8UD07_9PEZI|nr:uncharacterized protein BKA67DRAFT_682656 [Truncatella angustata]KAH6647453.1 hypothetical protein BKA67DRAFT_682656 [Truncatella angustata]
MSSTQFLFLNATGTSELSHLDAKQMRAHITRTNFAKRRKRIHGDFEAKAAETSSSYNPAVWKAAKPASRSTRSCGDDVPALPLTAQLAEQYCYAQFLSGLWSLVFQDGRDYPTNADEAAWIALLVSEPALLESSMAVGARHWSPDASFQRQAEAHWSRAAGLVARRIGSGAAAHVDAVLGAVLTMAFGERLRCDGEAWAVHIDGAAQLIRERRSRGVGGLPSWFYDLLILDSTNDLLGFPRFYHRKLADEASAYGHRPLSDVADICDGLSRLLWSLDAHRKDQPGPISAGEEVEITTTKLLSQARALRAHAGPHIRATSWTVELILHLSRGQEPGAADLEPAAGELREALCGLRHQPCSYMNLTSCTLMIGALAAGAGTPTRAWFVGALGGAVRALRSRGWDAPLDILEGGFVTHPLFQARFRSLWKELDR